MSAASFLRRLLGRSRAGVGRDTQHLVSLCEALLGERGEVSGAALARQALTAYQGLDERSREEFFDVLAQEFAPSPEAVGKAADAYRYEPTPQNLFRLQEIVDSALSPDGRSASFVGVHSGTEQRGSFRMQSGQNNFSYVVAE